MLIPALIISFLVIDTIIIYANTRRSEEYRLVESMIRNAESEAALNITIDMIELWVKNTRQQQQLHRLAFYKRIEIIGNNNIEGRWF